MARKLPILKRLASNKSGASAVELALVMPLLISALFATVDLARGFSARLDLVQAASRSAELATSLGSVRSDYAFLKAEAESAATASGQPNSIATINAWLECDGAIQQNMNGVCPAGQTFARYISVRVQSTYVPIFAASGLFAAAGVPVSGSATVRIQ